ncbi:MAG: DNA-binding domain-containing protein [Roseibium sp.]
MSVAIDTSFVTASGFGEALLDPDCATPEGIIGPDGKSAPKRFSVYRNNVIVSLCEALGETFPAIKSLLGDEYFSALARAFVVESPPKSPVLLWYGETFADFIEAFPPLSDYPYLSDVARVEWAWIQAYHAADAYPLDPAELSSIDPAQIGTVSFERHPAAQIVTSRWPIWDLVRANRFEPDVEIYLDLGSEQSVLITRPSLDVDVYLLRPGGDVFVTELLSNAPLGNAAAAAQQENELFSLPDCLSDCLSSGSFAGIQKND